MYFDLHQFRGNESIGIPPVALVDFVYSIDFSNFVSNKLPIESFGPPAAGNFSGNTGAFAGSFFTGGSYGEEPSYMFNNRFYRFICLCGGFLIPCISYES